jgi:hypothetical protein
VPTGPGKDRTLKNKKIKANLNMHEPNHKIIIVRKTIQSLLKKKKTATLSNQNPNPAKATSTRVF